MKFNIPTKDIKLVSKNYGANLFKFTRLGGLAKLGVTHVQYIEADDKYEFGAMESNGLGQDMDVKFVGEGPEDIEPPYNDEKITVFTNVRKV